MGTPAVLRPITDVLTRLQHTTTVRRFLAVAGIAVALGAVVVALALLRRDHGGFMHERCGDLRWSRADLPVFVFVDLPDEWESEVRDGMRLVDPEARLLAWGGTTPYGGEPSDPAIMVALMSAPLLGAREHGLSTLRWDASCRLRRVEVLLPASVPDGPVRARAVAHEMGHALGLAHSDDETSVMYPVATVRFEFELSPSDRERLAEAYSR